MKMKTPRDAVNSQYCVQNCASDYEGILKSALKVLTEQQLDTKFEKSKEIMIKYEYPTTSVLDYDTPIFSEHLKWLYDEIQLTQDKIFEQATLNILVDREVSFNGNNYLKIGDQMKDDRPLKDIEEFNEFDKIFLNLWTTATHQEGYDKKKWKDLQWLIQKWATKMRDNDLFKNGDSLTTNLRPGEVIKDSGIGFDLEVKQTENYPKTIGTQLIHDERITGCCTKQYLIDEFNEHLSKLTGKVFYDYEKHMYMKWVNASEHNKIASQEEQKEVCDCCWKEIPKDEHRILYEAPMTEKPNEYRVCFECYDKLQEMPHDKCNIAKSIAKIQNEGPLASQPVPIIDKEGRMEDHKDFDGMALLDEFVERVEKSKEEAKNSTNQQYDKCKQLLDLEIKQFDELQRHGHIKKILKETINHASDPSMSEQVFPIIPEEQTKIEKIGPQKEEENIKRRDSWYERYDKE
jgi:hypothetical protein